MLLVGGLVPRPRADVDAGVLQGRSRGRRRRCRGATCSAARCARPRQSRPSRRRTRRREASTATVAVRQPREARSHRATRPPAPGRRHTRRAYAPPVRRQREARERAPPVVTRVASRSLVARSMPYPSAARAHRWPGFRPIFRMRIMRATACATFGAHASALCQCGNPAPPRVSHSTCRSTPSTSSIPGDSS